MRKTREQIEEEDRFLLFAIILRAFGNGIIAAILLMIWREKNLSVNDEFIHWLFAAFALRIISLRLLRRYADTVDRAVIDVAMAGAAMLLFFVHGFLLGAVLAFGAGLLHWYRALRISPSPGCQT